LNRELHEEIGLCKKYYLDASNYFDSYVRDNYVDHFYVKEFSERDFEIIEQGALEAKEWGSETLGLIRVPTEDLDSRLPFQAFLQHNFVADARTQLLHAVIANSIISEERINQYLLAIEILKENQEK
uniref:Nudix hydrolase domain-containing protein n=1 Tax=Ciona savignyi TaxID=51511 RepID=H2YFZ1_CIOSA